MSFQQVILQGNLGQDPELRFSNKGNAIANISVATSKTIKNKETGQREDKTTWHRVVLFNRLGEIAGEYLKKGSKVLIVGEIQHRKWQDQQGQDRYTTEIVADQMQMLDAQGQQQQTQSQGYQKQPPQNQGQQQGQQPPSNDFSQDVPF